MAKFKRDRVAELDFYGMPYHEWLSQRRDTWRRVATVPSGVPVPGSGRSTWHSKRDRAGRNNGVSSGSRVLQHHYMSEGDKGRHIRRKVRRLEGVMWRAEAAEELSAILYDDDAYEECF